MTFLEGAQRHWTINGDFTTLSYNGVARYANEVTRNIDELLHSGWGSSRGLTVELVVPAATGDTFKAIRTRVLPEYSWPRLPQFWVQCQLPHSVKGGLISFCNLAPVAVARQIVCIHDLHTRIMPESYGLGFRIAHRLILPWVGRTAERVTTVSQTSAEHLVSYGIAGLDKIVVTYNGSEHTRRWNASASRIEWPSEPFVICLGRPQPYKNAELMWRIAPLLEPHGIKVIVVGDMPDKIVAGFGSKPDNLLLLGRVSDDDLAAGLQRALAYLFPSRIEGFGLPIVEAMSLGCPTISSNSPCLPEVCGGAAILKDPDDAEGWAEAVLKLQADTALRSTLVTLGRGRASLFSWRRIAETYLELMDELDHVSVVRRSSADIAAPRLSRA
jgi:glycosyltransferase involved in cell wall biosynthesis